MRILSLIVLVTSFAVPWSAKAQARNLTRRVVNPDNTSVRPSQPGVPAPTPPPPPARPVAPVPHPQAVVTNVVPEKTQEQKDELLRKTVEFQKKRAEAGAPSAQYDLGMRYLKGDGVEKDLDLAKKWLNASATNGNSQAIKKLEELNKK